MKKIFTFMLLAILTTVSSFLYIKAQDEADTLIVYYKRYDNNYNNHTIWLLQNLPTGLGGQEYSFSNDNVDPTYGSFIEIDLEEEGYADTTRFGIIVKEGTGWDGERERSEERRVGKECRCGGVTYH